LVLDRAFGLILKIGLNSGLILKIRPNACCHLKNLRKLGLRLKFGLRISLIYFIKSPIVLLVCQLSLFFDILLALCVGMTEERFIERGLLSTSGGVSDNALVRSARRLVWRQLNGFCMKAGSCCFCLFNFENFLSTRMLSIDSADAYFIAAMRLHYSTCNTTRKFSPVLWTLFKVVSNSW